MTLTELAVVIGIAGTLAAIAVPNYQQMMEKERIKKQQTDIELCIRQAQSDCIFQKRTAEISVADTRIVAVTIPTHQERVPTVSALSVGHPVVEAPPILPSEIEIPVTRTQELQFPVGYKAIYIDVRGMMYTLDSDSEPVCIGFKNVSVRVGPVQIKKESTPCP